MVEKSKQDKETDTHNAIAEKVNSKPVDEEGNDINPEVSNDAVKTETVA